MLRAERAWLAGALGLFAAIELALPWRFPIFFDEALFGSESQTLADHVTRSNAFLAVADNHGVLQRWLATAGIWAGLEPITAVRLISIASGLVIIGSVAVLARRINNRAAPFAAAAAALMPALVVHSAIGIADPLVVAAIAVAAVLVVRLGESPSRGAAAACALAVGLALFTKKTGLLAVGFVPLGALGVRRAGRPLRPWLPAAAVALAGGLVAWAVLRFGSTARLRELGAFYGRKQYKPLGEALADLPGHLGGALAGFASATAAYATAPLLVLAALGLIRCIQRRPDIALLLGAWIVAPFAFAVTAARFPYPRYVLSVFPPLAILAGVGFALVRDRLGQATSKRWLPPLLAAATLVPAAVFDLRVVANPRTAHYPGEDDRQYVSDFAAGTVWPALATQLRQRVASAPSRVVEVAWGGAGVGPIGLAAELGRPKLEEGTYLAGFFEARAAGHVVRFVPYREVHNARYLIAQDVNAVATPDEVRRAYKPLAVATRPHNGTAVALLERRP